MQRQDWRSAALQALAAVRRLNAATQAAAAAEEAYRLSRLGYDDGRTPFIEILCAGTDRKRRSGSLKQPAPAGCRDRTDNEFAIRWCKEIYAGATALVSPGRILIAGR